MEYLKKIIDYLDDVQSVKPERELPKINPSDFKAYPEVVIDMIYDKDLGAYIARPGTSNGSDAAQKENIKPIESKRYWSEPKHNQSEPEKIQSEDRQPGYFLNLDFISTNKKGNDDRAIDAIRLAFTNLCNVGNKT